MEIIGTAIMQQNGTLHLPPGLMKRMEIKFANTMIDSIKGDFVQR